MKKETDKLEQFIKNHRNDFETEFNSGGAWSKIESQLPKKRSRKSIWMRAAVFVGLLSIGWLIYERAHLTDKINEMENLTVSNKPYSEIESYYMQNIEEKTEIVNHLASEENIKVNTDLKSLNNKYKELKVQVKKQGGHPQLVNAMIQNLQMQIEILEQQLNILQDIQENSQNEKEKKNEISI